MQNMKHAVKVIRKKKLFEVIAAKGGSTSCCVTAFSFHSFCLAVYSRWLGSESLFTFLLVLIYKASCFYSKSKISAHSNLNCFPILAPSFHNE